MQFYKIVNEKAARLTQELEAQFAEGRTIEEKIRKSLKNIAPTK